MSRIFPIALLFAWVPGSNLTAQLNLHLPMYKAQDKMLYAKVKMADGSALPGFPAMEALCGGVAYPLGFTDTQGNFRLVIASGGDRFKASFNDSGTTMDLTVLADCEFRAEFPGARSQHVSPRWLKEMKEANTISLGTIVLTSPKENRSETRGEPAISKQARNAYKKGGSALADGKWDEAKGEFEKAVALQPTYYSAWMGMGLAEEALDRVPDAEEAFQKALKLRPKSPYPYLSMARLEAKAGHWDQTEEYSEAALGLDPRNLVEGYSLCAMANVKLQQPAAAASSARAGLRLETASEYPDLWLSLALAQAAEKQYANAAASLEEYLKLVPQADHIPEVKVELAGLRAHFRQ